MVQDFSAAQPYQFLEIYESQHRTFRVPRVSPNGKVLERGIVSLLSDIDRALRREIIRVNNSEGMIYADTYPRLYVAKTLLELNLAQPYVVFETVKSLMYEKKSVYAHAGAYLVTESVVEDKSGKKINRDALSFLKMRKNSSSMTDNLLQGKDVGFFGAAIPYPHTEEAPCGFRVVRFGRVEVGEKEAKIIMQQRIDLIINPKVVEDVIIQYLRNKTM
ncbi:hypothetical protein HYX00_03910 [Candidatus Woesearchaeota archaeon]|nr:hypothetical protein [Candidatus Woesearchaeota archaeon]